MICAGTASDFSQMLRSMVPLKSTQAVGSLHLVDPVRN